MEEIAENIFQAFKLEIAQIYLPIEIKTEIFDKLILEYAYVMHKNTRIKFITQIRCMLPKTYFDDSQSETKYLNFCRLFREELNIPGNGLATNMSVTGIDVELKTFINMTLELVNKIKVSLLYNRFVYDKQKNKFLFNETEKLESTLLQKFKDFHKDLWSQNTCPCCYGQGIPLQCQHVICIPCLSKLKQNSCPMCREKIILHFDLDVDGMDEDEDVVMDVVMDVMY